MVWILFSDTANQCKCANFPDQVVNVSHCVSLNGSLPFCFLQEGEKARYCPKAKPSTLWNGTVLRDGGYITTDKSTCERSVGKLYTENRADSHRNVYFKNCRAHWRSYFFLVFSFWMRTIVSKISTKWKSYSVYLSSL